MAVFPGFACLPVTLSQLNLAVVLRSGQSFRWTRHSVSPCCTSPATVEWRYCAQDRVFCLRQTPVALWWKAVYPDGLDSPERNDQSELWLKDYLQFNVDLGKLYTEFSTRDPIFSAVSQNLPGIPILRQDPWETLISFICSANNNIPRITKMVHSLAKQYSPPLISLPDPEHPSEVITYHPFPPPVVLAAPSVGQELRALGFGYRAEYIQRTAAMLVEDHSTEPTAWLRALRTLETSIAREELLKFVGVGRKVADCILLFSLDKHSVVPVDTHVLQIGRKHYRLPGKTSLTPKLYDIVASKFTEIWGPYAGWAHSILFTADLKDFSKEESNKSHRPVGDTNALPSSPMKRRRESLNPSTPEASQKRRK